MGRPEAGAAECARNASQQACEYQVVPAAGQQEACSLQACLAPSDRAGALAQTEPTLAHLKPRGVALRRRVGARDQLLCQRRAGGRARGGLSRGARGGVGERASVERREECLVGAAAHAAGRVVVRPLRRVGWRRGRAQGL